MRENNQCLLSIIKFKLSNENQNFGNLYLLLWAWQLFYKDFFDETGVILMKVILWYHILKCVNLWKTCITQWTNIFQCMTTAKSCIGKKKKNPFKGLERPMDFNVTEYEKFINMTSDCTLLLTFKKSPIFWVWCSIKGEYPHLFEKVIKILLPFPIINLCEARFLHILQFKHLQQTECKSRSENPAVFY